MLERFKVILLKMRVRYESDPINVKFKMLLGHRKSLEVLGENSTLAEVGMIRCCMLVSYINVCEHCAFKLVSALLRDFLMVKSVFSVPHVNL